MENKPGIILTNRADIAVGWGIKPLCWEAKHGGNSPL